MVKKSQLYREAWAEIEREMSEYLDAWEDTFRQFILDQRSGELDDLSEGEGDDTGPE